MLGSEYTAHCSLAVVLFVSSFVGSYTFGGTYFVTSFSVWESDTSFVRSFAICDDDDIWFCDWVGFEVVGPPSLTDSGTGIALLINYSGIGWISVGNILNLGISEIVHSLNSLDP